MFTSVPPPSVPASPRRNRMIPLAIAGGVLAVIVITIIGVTAWNAVKYANDIVDSCGNTAKVLASPGMVQPCVSVSGTVKHVTPLPNGDLQVQIRPAQDYAYARNTENQALQENNLLVLLPCGSPVTLPSEYFRTCAAFKNASARPAGGLSLTYTGNLVINQKYGWVEMKPVSDAPGA